jgi:hypothetical protein
MPQKRDQTNHFNKVKDNWIFQKLAGAYCSATKTESGVNPYKNPWVSHENTQKRDKML